MPSLAASHIEAGSKITMSLIAKCRMLSLIAIASLSAGFLAFISGAHSADQGISGLQTNQSYVDKLKGKSGVDLANPLSVFRSILTSLPKTVKVYPTENYYYFSFYDRGIRYGGNIRLAIDGLAKREIYFTYFPSATLQHPDGEGQRLVLNASNGVDVKRITDLSWNVSAFGKTVRFNLNDLSKVHPPKGLMRKQETFIGPVFDESGLRFFLLFDKAKANFLYVLDETVDVPEQFSGSEADASFQLGRRTGFLFAVDEKAGSRKVLAGVFAANVELNNYYDGPFDQLPDNFIKDDRLRNALIARQPDLKDRIDRYGNLAGGETRAVIAPYATYESPEDLVALARCMERNGLPVADDCLSNSNPQAQNN